MRRHRRRPISADPISAIATRDGHQCRLVVLALQHLTGRGTQRGDIADATTHDDLLVARVCNGAEEIGDGGDGGWGGGHWVALCE